MGSQLTADGWNSQRRPVVVPAGWRPDEAQGRPDTARVSFHDMTSRLTALERAPVFFAFPESVLRSIARRVRRIKVAAGDTLVTQGEPGDSLFFIERGRCRMVVENGATIVTVAVLAEGDFFGDSACILGRPQQASVYAQTDCYLLALDRQSLHAVASGLDDDLLQELHHVAERRFSAFADVTVQATWGQLFEEATVVGVY